MTGREIYELGLDHEGDAYALTGWAPIDDPYRTVYDCSHLASAMVYQASGKVYGCAPGSTPSWADPFTGHWWRDVVSGAVIGCTVDDAIRTEGALLLRKAVPGAMGHVVISDGRGGTIEAMGSAYGVCRGKTVGRRWDTGILIPEVAYVRGVPIDPKPVRVIRIWNRGPDVVAIQTRLGLTPDGIYGPKTEAAVVAFQQRSGLIVDGEVGPATWAALRAG